MGFNSGFKGLNVSHCNCMIHDLVEEVIVILAKKLVVPLGSSQSYNIPSLDPIMNHFTSSYAVSLRSVSVFPHVYTFRTAMSYYMHSQNCKKLLLASSVCPSTWNKSLDRLL